MLVLDWYHRQFSEAASERYCQPSLRAILHTGLADFFSGLWAQGRTPIQRDQDYCISLPSNTTSLIKVIFCTSFFFPFSFVPSFSVSLISLYLTSSLALDYIPIFVLFGSGNKKPYTDRQGKSDAMDRHVADQPYKIGEQYNARKLNNLAYHRIMSEDLDRSKEDCLCNFQFILHRIKGTSVR